MRAKKDFSTKELMGAAMVGVSMQLRQLRVYELCDGLDELCDGFGGLWGNGYRYKDGRK